MGEGREDAMPRGSEAWLRRQAIQIACQLPDDPVQALKVLAYASELVNGFLAADQADSRPNGGSSPNLRAISILKPEVLPR